MLHESCCCVLRQARGVPVHRLVHREGSFVVTFPNAYHAGFNTGARTTLLAALRTGLLRWHHSLGFAAMSPERGGGAQSMRRAVFSSELGRVFAMCCLHGQRQNLD